MTKLTTSSSCLSLEQVYRMGKILVNTPNLKAALDEITPILRSIFIFDNLVIYLKTPDMQVAEVLFARAVGRGRSAEADIPWGEPFAMEVIHSGKTTINEADSSAWDRLKNPFLLSIPLIVSQHTLGAVVFIRFGGPAYSPEDVALAEYINGQIALLVERERQARERIHLERRHQQAQLQEDFFSTITHELSSPLGFIKGYTTTLLRADANWNQETQQEFLQIIDQETDNLQALIENLLDSARLQSGQLRMEFQLVRLDALLSDVTARAKLHHPDLQISIHAPHIIAPIEGDPHRLAQVFENLISNAVKYAPNTEVTLNIAQTKKDCLISISDQGSGIAEEYIVYLFDRFFRIPNTAPNVHGSGLGLFICRQIVQAHQGEIWAESKMGAGATFKIRLPTHQRATTLKEYADDSHPRG